VRDLFYSMLRGVGNIDHYWNVWPLGQFRRQTDFYHTQKIHVDDDEVIEILVREGIAKR
jgi:hypothetical protein